MQSVSEELAELACDGHISYAISLLEMRRSERGTGKGGPGTAQLFVETQ